MVIVTHEWYDSVLVGMGKQKRPVAPERIWKWKGGAPVRNKSGGTYPALCPAKAPEKNFFGRAAPLFGSKGTISRFGERFRDGQYTFGQFLVCCFSTHGAPRAKPFVKVGRGHVPPCPMESAPLERSCVVVWKPRVTAQMRWGEAGRSRARRCQLLAIFAVLKCILSWSLCVLEILQLKFVKL